MAFILPNKFPIDTLPDVAVGVSVPFSGEAVFNQTYITKDQVKSNLINFFLTNKGERYFNPNFGGNLRATIFEAISNNTLSALETQLKDQLSVLFPRVKVQALQVNSLPDQNLINITLSYSVLNQSIDNIQINFASDGI